MGSLFNYSGRHVLKTCIPKPTILRIKNVFSPFWRVANNVKPIRLRQFLKKALVDYVLSLLTEISWNVSYNFLLLGWERVRDSVSPCVHESVSPSVCQSVSPLVHWSVRPSICPPSCRMSNRQSFSQPVIKLALWWSHQFRLLVCTHAYKRGHKYNKWQRKYLLRAPCKQTCNQFVDHFSLSNLHRLTCTFWSLTFLCGCFYCTNFWPVDKTL